MDLNDTTAGHLVSSADDPKLISLLERMVGRSDVVRVIAKRSHDSLQPLLNAQPAARTATALLFDTAVHLAIEYLHAQRAGASRAWLDATTPAIDLAQLAVRQRQLQRESARLPEIVSQLDPSLRRIFVMRYVEENSRQKIAERLGMSEQQVGELLEKALFECRTRLAALVEEGIDS